MQGAISGGLMGNETPVASTQLRGSPGQEIPKGLVHFAKWQKEEPFMRTIAF